MELKQLGSIQKRARFFFLILLSSMSKFGDVSHKNLFWNIRKHLSWKYDFNVEICIKGEFFLQAKSLNIFFYNSKKKLLKIK